MAWFRGGVVNTVRWGGRGAEAIVAIEQLATARAKVARRAEEARQAEVIRLAEVNAEVNRQEKEARQAAQLAQAEAKARDHQRATEATMLLRVAHEVEHTMLTHYAEERANLLRREKALIAARHENANLTVALVVAKKASEDNLAAATTQVIQTEAAKKVDAKAERTTRIGRLPWRAGPPP